MAFKYLVISYLENIRRPRNADQTNTIPEFAYILRGRTFLVCQSSISDTANRMQTLHHGSPKYLTTASVPHEFDFCLCMWFSGPTNEALQCAIPSHSNSSSNGSQNAKGSARKYKIIKPTHALESRKNELSQR
jgi:hypothetical protein